MKKPFLLLELLIALSLISMLTLLLFSFLKQNLIVEQKMDQTRHLVLERQSLQARIQDLVMSIRTDTDSPFYTQIFPKETFQSLILTFDHGIDPDPFFSGSLTGRLFVDENRNLSLAYWPNDPDKKHYWRKEILLPNVSDFSMEFLSESKDPQKKSFWDLSWPKTKKTPSILRITLTQNKNRLQFAFILPNTQPKQLG